MDAIIRSGRAGAYFVYLLCVIFVGDFYLESYSIYAFWPLALCGAFFWLPLTKNVVRALIICTPFSLFLCTGFFWKLIEPGYFNAPLFMLVAILALGGFEKILVHRERVVYWISAASLFLFFVFASLSDAANSRFSLVFGPTILYRIVLIFYAVCLVFDIRDNRKIWMVVLTGIAFYSVLKIGSRGGVVAFLFIWVLIGYRYFSLRHLLFFAAALVVGYIASDIDAILSSRAFYFSDESESSNVRLDKLWMAQAFLNGPEVALGMMNPRIIVGNYPHNIFVEMLIFHGIFAFLAFVILCLYAALIFLRKSKEKQWISDVLVIFSPVLVGSLFSGNLLDNYFFVSVLCYVIGSHYAQKKMMPVPYGTSHRLNQMGRG